MGINSRENVIQEIDICSSINSPSERDAGLLATTFAHPGEHHEHNEAAELSKREFKSSVRRGLAGCAEKLQARGGVMNRAIARRSALVSKHRKARGLEVRDTDTVVVSVLDISAWCDC